MSLSPPYTPHTALAVVEIASDSDVSRTLTSHTEIRVIPNLSGKSGTGDRSRERNGTVVKRILTLPCPALHLPEVQHELLIHSIISGGTRVIFTATVSILCGNCWRVALVQVYFFAEFQCLPLLSTCSSRALCAAAALKQRGLSRVSSSRCLSLSSRSVVHQSRNRTPSFPSSLSQVPTPVPLVCASEHGVAVARRLVSGDGGAPGYRHEGAQAQPRPAGAPSKAM